MNVRRIIRVYKLHHFICYLRLLRLILSSYCFATLDHKPVKERTEYVKFYHDYKCKYCDIALGPIFIKREYRHEFNGKHYLTILIDYYESD